MRKLPRRQAIDSSLLADRCCRCGLLHSSHDWAIHVDRFSPLRLYLKGLHEKAIDLSPMKVDTLGCA